MPKRQFLYLEKIHILKMQLEDGKDFYKILNLLNILLIMKAQCIWNKLKKLWKDNESKLNKIYIEYILNNFYMQLNYFLAFILTLLMTVYIILDIAFND